MQWPFKTTVRYVRKHKPVRIQYAVCDDNVGAARRQLLRRFTEQHADGYEIENVVAATGQEAAWLNLPDDYSETPRDQFVLLPGLVPGVPGETGVSLD